MTENEPTVATVDSPLFVIAVELLCHIENKRINIFNVIIAITPILRCVASAYCFLISFEDYESGSLVEYFFREYF